VWEVEVTDEFIAWWDSLTEDLQTVVDSGVRQLVDFGPPSDGRSSIASKILATTT
jgi:hypothetical protein